jgi:hypothetical protein
MDSLQPSMTIEIPGQISGDRIITDLLGRIEAVLVRTGDLRAVDCYHGYSAKISIRLQVHDLDTNEVSTEVAVGSFDPQKPRHATALEPVVAGEADDFQSLERPVDPSGVEETPARDKRWYAPRNRPNRIA